MSRVSRSLAAQRATSVAELEHIASEQGWSSEELTQISAERFGTRQILVTPFESYLQNLAQAGWEDDSIEFVKRNVVSCSNVLFSKNPLIADDRSCGYGLVVGRIQSGKTAHMLGLASHLLENNSDYGWKKCNLVIILSGLIEDLRIQTLNRAKESNIYSVPVFPQIDFKPSDETSKVELTNALKTKSGIMVIKKNHEILEELNSFLMSAEIEAMMLERKVVIIDDECDHASVDSGHAEAGEADEITRTNRAVRGVIQSCSLGLENTWYIGYTATPYSNLLMHTNPEYAQVQAYGRTLFPRDFIYCIDEQPIGHLDNETIFHGNLENAIVPQQTPPAESLEEESLLERFVFLHIISRIIRSGLEEGFHHTSMIHASRSVDDHMYVSDTLSSIKESLLSRTTGELEETALEIVEEYFSSHVDAFLENLTPLDEYSESRIMDEIGFIEIIKLNSDDQQDIDALAYPSALKYPDNESKSFIVVGGQKLSRGLTLEGLVVSWLARTSQEPRYDTMLQMARWCGFRSPFEDLIRIFLPQETIEHYSHITEVEIRLRDDLYEMGPYANPIDELHWIREYNGMLISGKIPDSVRRRASGGGLVPSDYYSMNLAEDFDESNSFALQQSRFDCFIDFEMELTTVAETNNGYQIYRGIDSFVVSNFLIQYTSEYPEHSDQRVQLELISESCELNNEIQWNVCISSNRLTRMGYRHNGRLFLRQGRRRMSLLDLDDGRFNREYPMLLIHLEDSSTTNSGIPVYSDNGIPIIHIGIFLPDQMAPSVFYEIARPEEEE